MLEEAPAARRLARLPGRLTPLVGRDADLQSLCALLQDDDVRLVTLLGIGGVGKTALALQVAHRLHDKFENNVAFVPLAQLTALDELLPALAQVLDVQLPPSGDLQQAVLDHLSGLEMLLVLDSFEHLVDEALLIRDILVAAPRVRVLVTSTEKLNLEAESIYSLPGLQVPPGPDLAGALPSDAVTLFVLCARRIQPKFSADGRNGPAIVDICRMVHGNPLGILLAASWVGHFSPAEIAEQARSSLDFLTHTFRDVEPRHSSLRAVFEGSFQRLDAKHQDILRKLSVFRGGFDLEAAAVVAGAELANLVSLVDKCMLVRVPETGRYELHGLVQQYARQLLIEAGELDRILAAHSTYYCAFVEASERRILSGGQSAALDALQADLGNIRQAWSRVVAQRDLAIARRTLPGLYAFSDMRSRFYEGEAMFRLAAEGLAPLHAEAPDGAWALALLSWFDMYMYIESPDSYDEILSQARGCLEQAHISNDAQGAAASLNLLGAIAQHQGDFKSAIQYCQEAMRLFPELDGVYWVNMRIGLCYEADHRYSDAIRMFEGCLLRGKRTGEAVKTGWALQNIGDTLTLQGNTVEAEAYLDQALSTFRQVGTPIGVLWATHSLCQLARAQANLERARQLAQAAAQLALQLHSASWIRKTDNLLAELEPGAADGARALPKSSDEALSPRELAVLNLLKSELSGPEIARTLVVSLNTVRFHTKHIYQKLGASSRLEAIRRARELGL